MGAMHFAHKLPRFLAVAIAATVLVFCACERREAPVANVSHERSVQPNDFSGIPGEVVSFYSQALQRRMRYFVLLPADYQSNTSRHYAVLYLLHGGGKGGHPEEWAQQSSVMQNLRGREWITVLPQADLSWYVNAALSPQDRYEDYIAHDLRVEIDSHYRTRADRGSRGIAGISMGGYGAAFLTLKHPDVYSFAGLFGASLDASRRWFNVVHISQGIQERNTFGPLGHGRDNYDPFVLLTTYHGQSGPLFIWSMCGDRDSFLSLHRKFNQALSAAHIQHTFVSAPGGHDWLTWSSQFPAMLHAWSAWIDVN